MDFQIYIGIGLNSDLTVNEIAELSNNNNVAAKSIVDGENIAPSSLKLNFNSPNDAFEFLVELAAKDATFGDSEGVFIQDILS